MGRPVCGSPIRVMTRLTTAAAYWKVMVRHQVVRQRFGVPFLANPMTTMPEVVGGDGAVSARLQSGPRGSVGRTDERAWTALATRDRHPPRQLLRQHGAVSLYGFAQRCEHAENTSVHGMNRGSLWQARTQSCL